MIARCNPCKAGLSLLLHWLLITTLNLVGLLLRPMNAALNRPIHKRVGIVLLDSLPQFLQRDHFSLSLRIEFNIWLTHASFSLSTSLSAASPPCSLFGLRWLFGSMCYIRWCYYLDIC